LARRGGFDVAHDTSFTDNGEVSASARQVSASARQLSASRGSFLPASRAAERAITRSGV
jgi:hypothetical protein